jgi:hypothetical protein
MADFLTKKRGELEKRLRELRPLHEEYIRLERAMQALESADVPAPAPRTPSTNGRRRRGTPVRRRRRRGGTRGEQALEVVRQNPGITVSELGDKLGIAQKNYLYRVMNNLQADGAVRKQGRGYSAA